MIRNVKNIDNHLYEKFIKSGKLKEQLYGIKPKKKNKISYGAK